MYMLARMTTIIILVLLSVAAISAISLIGVLGMSLSDRLMKTSLFGLVSLAVGALLGDAFIHLIPEAYADSPDPLSVSIAIVSGILMFFVIEKVLHWHHHQGLEDQEHATKPLGNLVLLSDGVHNLIDGLIIGASYLVSIEVGIATTIAIILHEIPQEIADFGVLVHAGFSKAKALWFNFLSALAAFAGAAIALIIGTQATDLVAWLVPIAAGGFIYIALSDLIPELHNQEDKSARHAMLQFAWVMIGVLSMILLLNLEPEGHAHELRAEPSEIHIEDGHEEEAH